MENSSEIPAHGINRSVKLFLQPIKLHEISIMLRSWNYIKDIQIFVMSMTFISSSEVKIYIGHEWRSHE